MFEYIFIEFILGKSQLICTNFGGAYFPALFDVYGFVQVWLQKIFIFMKVTIERMPTNHNCPSSIRNPTVMVRILLCNDNVYLTYRKKNVLFHAHIIFDLLRL